MASLAPTTPVPRPYRRFLTSALHTRFVHATLISLLLALNNSFWLGSKKDLFWSWFPFGPAGIKALVFFMSNLFIFLLQIATLRVGRQTTTSPFTTVRRTITGAAAIQTFIWYAASAWWFTEAYIWSSPTLGWVERGNHVSPDKLNEKPIFFRAYALMLAVVAAFMHLYHGRSSLILPIKRLPSTPNAEQNALGTHPVKSIKVQLQQTLRGAFLESICISAVMALVSPFIFNYTLRSTFYQLHLTIAKLFFNLSRSNAYPTTYPSLGVMYIIESFVAGSLLLMTWALTAALFLVYINQEPTKAGLPLSALSNDPNGTLLTGLKAKRDVIKTFAFWELAIIAQKHKDRRRAIFEDIERSSGPMWNQMLEAGLDVLRGIELRITGPPPQPPAQPTTITSLPRIVQAPASASIFAAEQKPSIRDTVVSGTWKHLGTSQDAWRPPIEQATKAVETKFLEYVKPAGADKKSSQGLLEQWTASLQQSSVGWVFTSTRSSKINSVVLGSPTGNAAIIVDVVDAITKMLVASLSEDTYGKATPTVPETVRVFTRTLNSIENLIENSQKGSAGQIDEVDIIVERLRAGLKELLAAFQLYLIDVGLGITELNQAKKAVASPQDEQEVQEQPKAVEPPVRRQLFPASEQKRGNGQRNGRQNNAPQAISSGRNPSGETNGRVFQRREMEQVR